MLSLTLKLTWLFSVPFLINYELDVISTFIRTNGFVAIGTSTLYGRLSVQASLCNVGGVLVI